MYRSIVGVIGFAALSSSQPPARPTRPLVSGLTLVSALQSPVGDQENVVRVDQLSAEGATYSWHLRERAKSGDSIETDARRFVRTSDLASAPRYNGVFRAGQEEETPGYTAFSLSRASYNLVRARGEIPFAVTWVEEGPLAAFAVSSPVNLTSPRVTIRGKLAQVKPEPEALSVLVNGRRAELPAIHLEGRFGPEGSVRVQDYWILADSANPLIMKIRIGDAVLQLIRIDFPDQSATLALERDLGVACRAELPGIYFAFGSARLDPASNPALAAIASLVTRHPEWAFTIEGHTDNVGDVAANQRLSVQRADAVRDAVVRRSGAGAGRLRSAGFGATRPRETNATLDGRASNRRVELVRSCPGKS
jgi:OmpA family